MTEDNSSFSRRRRRRRDLGTSTTARPSCHRQSAHLFATQVGLISIAAALVQISSTQHTALAFTYGGHRRPSVALFDISTRAGSRTMLNAQAASADDASSSRGGADDDNDDSNAKDRAMAALSNPGGELPSNPDAGGGKDPAKGGEEASTSGAAAASILPPLPGYESDFGSEAANGSARVKDRRKRRPHVKMKRRPGQRGSSRRERVVKPSSFSSSASTPSSLLPPNDPLPDLARYKSGVEEKSLEESLLEWEKKKGTAGSNGGGSDRRGNKGDSPSSAPSSLLPPISGGSETSPLDWGDWFQSGKSKGSNSEAGALLPDLPPIPGTSSAEASGRDDILSSRPPSTDELPSVSDLFAPSTLASKSSPQADSELSGGKSASEPDDSRFSSSSGALEGVIPVSELFYRSTQSISVDDYEDEFLREKEKKGVGARRRDLPGAIKDNVRHPPRKPSPDDDSHDDEELPFSIEQSDRLETDGNKIRIRRNEATSSSNASKRKPDRRGRQGPGRGRGRGRQSRSTKGKRKMVRRGMEMLVGGEPINADPPLRYMDLYYNRGPSPDSSTADIDYIAFGFEDATADDSRKSPIAPIAVDWTNSISLNSRDFGPLLHNPSIPLVSQLSRGIYCEHFVSSALKWKICPKDFRDIVKTHELSMQKKRKEENTDEETAKARKATGTSGISNLQLQEQEYSNIIDGIEDAVSAGVEESNNKDAETSEAQEADVQEPKAQEADVQESEAQESNGIESEAQESDVQESDIEIIDQRNLDGKVTTNTPGVARDETADKHKKKSRGQEKEKSRGFGSGAGFGSSKQKRPKKGDRGGSEAKHLSPPSSFHPAQSIPGEGEEEEENLSSSLEATSTNRRARRRKATERKAAYDQVCLSGGLKFTIGLTRTELESGHDGGSGGHILRRVLSRGIATGINADSWGLNVRIAKLILRELDGGSTDVDIDFHMIAKPGQNEAVMLNSGKINAALGQLMDDGEMAVNMAAAAREEKAWPSKIRDRVVEEFLFEEDDEEDEAIIKNAQEKTSMEHQNESSSENSEGRNGDSDEYDGPFGMPGDTIYEPDDIYLGGGNGGVFYDYSETGVDNSPFKGELGPLLVDAATQRAIRRHPRVIAIGDVHGCLDELQMLLRRCDYQPGDLVVFLGDLVSKGPDSLSVVQMAREIGAIGVRGNHDFEVIRWHQAMKSGADPPVIGSEHFHIASGLSTADLKWMYSLPWYISSKELGALFVHAGFVSGIRLGKQNPRLMMNMRSILPDGTVTSKFFNNWPWARLWDGPQTVLFGHDADRGLQQYEHAIGLDTGCVYGGRLTACILPEKRLVSVSARREYFQYRRKHFD
eukprot:CAMPEP_0181022152 /NCGR_PEP_ID=MMETSP1070-20121207/1363_1 /TAXON_ID=265543 /ORGANISM="Minutocellus polymorphus, Strain NH13" /LENGTH=1334 /DNA_ID=CAMNT_0023099077 /DNA_START=16 /DNA_END=4020 /DNA_ORIENTATION=-